MTPDEKIEWLITSDSLDDVAVYPETCEVIRNVYPRASTQGRQKLIQAMRDVAARDNEVSEGPKGGDRKLYDWFDVLLSADPNCELAQTAFDDVESRHLEWKTKERPDLLIHTSKAFRVREISPWPIDDLLSKSALEWVDTVLDFTPPPWGSSFVGDLMDEERAAKGVRDAASRQIAWGIDFAQELIRRAEWQHDIWQGLIGAWQEAELDEQQCQEVLTLLQTEELILMHGNSITHLLYGLVENGGRPNAIRLLATAKQVARTIWDCSKNEEPVIQGPADWLMLALNSNAGMVVRFWLSALWVQSERGTKRSGRLIEEDREFFDLVVEDAGRRGKLGLAMLTSQLGYLLSFDYEWTNKRLLPLFDPDRDAFVPVWHGFTWGHLRSDVGELLKPKFLLAVKDIDKIERVGDPARRDEFVRHYAKMMVYAVDDPLSEWAPALFLNGNDQDSYTFAWEVGRILENMADAQKTELWNRWLQRYWENRLAGKPKPLGPKEVKQMLRWPKDLEVVFSDAVALATQMPPTKLEHLRIAKYIVDEGLASSFPIETAQLLDFVDKMETNYLNWHEIDSVIETLLGSELEETLLNKIKDIQVRRGSIVSA